MLALPASSNGCELRKCWISNNMLNPFTSTAPSDGIRYSVLLRKQTILLLFLFYIYYHNYSITTRALCCMWLLWYKGKTSRLEAEEQLLPKASCSQTCLVSFRLWICLPVLLICKRQCRYIASLLFFRAPSSSPCTSRCLFQYESFIVGTSKGHFHIIFLLGGRNLVMSFSKTIKSYQHHVAISLCRTVVILGALCKKSLLH